eukprot:TRINITY_DN297_c0_g1_i10.p1 TRINITY_DN297_c0_g1~~TRINITY_DN297_c0_g1_i10.p1  ORF type:complete len:144 (+),score=1.71 TRINITY_DN297_c0_g1_i10:1611-2042(+)
MSDNSFSTVMRQSGNNRPASTRSEMGTEGPREDARRDFTKGHWSKKLDAARQCTHHMRVLGFGCKLSFICKACTVHLCPACFADYHEPVVYPPQSTPSGGPATPKKRLRYQRLQTHTLLPRSSSEPSPKSKTPPSTPRPKRKK